MPPSVNSLSVKTCKVAPVLTRIHRFRASPRVASVDASLGLFILRRYARYARNALVLHTEKVSRFSLLRVPPPPPSLSLHSFLRTLIHDWRTSGRADERTSGRTLSSAISRLGNCASSLGLRPYHTVGRLKLNGDALDGDARDGRAFH